MLLPESQLSEMGVAAFNQMKQEKPVSKDAKVNAYVQCVAKAITDQLGATDVGRNWEVVVFDDQAANAFALPGAKIGVFTGLLSVAKNQDQLATVIGHEVGHVLAHHSNERASQAGLTQVGLTAASVAIGSNSSEGQMLMAALGLGAQVGILLPYGRAQENEADLIGLDLMSKSGFDPRESVALWRNMSAASSAQPLEFLSTHPGHETRMRNLGERIPQAMGLFETAQAAGRRPACKAQ
jgi:predicted Zn-dependent protease